MTTQTLTGKQTRMIAAIAAGQTLFTHAPSGWMIIGPAATITPGATVTVTKANGTTSRVVVDILGAAGESHGTAYQVATFLPTARPTRTTPQRHHPTGRSRYPRRRRDHEDCLSLGCCGPTCEYGATLGCTDHHHTY